MPIDYASFMIRLWRENDPQSPAPKSDWLAEVEHIQSGEHWKFNTLDDLLAFLQVQCNYSTHPNFPIE
jgi:hypothetical protein